MTSFRWLIRREIWEHRAFYIVPLVFLTLLVLVYTFGLLSHGPDGRIAIAVNDHPVDLAQMLQDEPEARQMLRLAAGGLPFIVPASILNTVMLFVLFFYLTDSLYAERKDRSVLFWKSLPVDDTSTVLSKLATAMVVVPLLTLVATMIAAIGMTLANTLFVWTIGESAWSLVWSQVPFLSGPATIAYGLITQSLWYAPVFGWLLLASVWARRAPALWALLPPAGIALLEGTLLHDHRFLQLVAHRLQPVVPAAFRDQDFEAVLGEVQSSPDTIPWAEAFGSMINPGAFLADPGMWGGLVTATVFVAGAIWLRRYRSDF